MLKLTRYNKGMQELIKQTIKGLKDVGGFGMIVFLFIFIWALLGMELFAYTLNMDQQGNFIKPDDAKRMFQEDE